MSFKKEHIPWNKGLTKKEYKSHYKNGFGGTFEKGNEPYNKGKKGLQIAWNKGIPRTETEKINISESLKNSEANKGDKNPQWGKIGTMLGKNHSEETKRKISEANIGNKHPNWKGGITPLELQIRQCFKYRQWRSDIFTKDNFTCQDCGQVGGNLNAHHIKSFSRIIQYYEITILEEALNCEELRNINNGITLCEKCHRKYHKNIGRRNII